MNLHTRLGRLERKLPGKEIIFMIQMDGFLTHQGEPILAVEEWPNDIRERPPGTLKGPWTQ